MAFFKKLFTADEISLPNPFNSPYIPALDGLRGVAILTVLFGHIAINTPFVMLDPGDIGVEIFFVLSGFLITGLLLKEKIKTGNISLKNFYIRRVLRILPVAYLFLLVLLALDHLFKLNLSAASYLAAAFYVRNFPLPNVVNWYNGHFWTLSIEEQFYIIFPFFIVYFFKRYIRLVFFLILVSPLLSYLAFHNIGIFYSNYVVHKLTYLLIYVVQLGTVLILIGSLFAILMFKQLLPLGALISKRYSGLAIFITALLGRMAFNKLMIINYWVSISFALMIALAICIVLYNHQDYLCLLLTNKWLIKLGVLSYSLYIWQQLFLYKQPWAHLFNHADSLLLNVPALFLAAYTSYHFYELRFLKLKNKFQKSSIAIKSPATRQI